MSKGVSVALIPTISTREYVLVVNQVKPLQKALSDYEIHICLDDLDKLVETNDLIIQILATMQSKLDREDRLYKMLKTYRTRCRNVKQLYRKWKLGNVEANKISHAAYLVLRGIPFYPDIQHSGWIMKSNHQTKIRRS